MNARDARALSRSLGWSVDGGAPAFGPSTNPNMPAKLSQAELFRVRDVPRAVGYFLAEERYTYVIIAAVRTITILYTMVEFYFLGWITNFLIDYVRHPEPKPSSLPMLLLICAVGVLDATMGVVRLSAKTALGRICLNASFRARVWGFERLMDLSLAWHQEEATGNKSRRVLSGSEAVGDWIRGLVEEILPVAIAFVASLIASLALHPAFMLFFAYYLVVLLSIEVHFDRRILSMSDRVNESMERANGALVENVGNIQVIKAMGASERMTSAMAGREDLARRLRYDQVRTANNKWMCVQVHVAICWVAYLLIIGSMVMHGRLSVGFFMTYALYFAKMHNSSTDLVDRMQAMIERKSTLGRMMPIFSGNGVDTGTEKFPLDWKKISIQEAAFSYGDALAIGPLNLEIARGEIVGIVGHSGSGKSTLIRLLLGLYHVQGGCIKIGDTSVAEIRHDDLTARVAVVLQEVELFNLSLKENICMMRDVEPALLERAIEVACLEDVIRRLPQGLDTTIGERGCALSGGERQRVGIARAVCRDAPMLLLDEATSALDSSTEQEVMRGLFDFCSPDRTMVVIAHRVSTLRGADRVVVFERGQLVEQGSFESLGSDVSTRFSGMLAAQQS